MGKGMWNYLYLCLQEIPPVLNPGPTTRFSYVLTFICDVIEDIESLSCSLSFLLVAEDQVDPVIQVVRHVLTLLQEQRNVAKDQVDPVIQVVRHVLTLLQEQRNVAKDLIRSIQWLRLLDTYSLSCKNREMSLKIRSIQWFRLLDMYSLSCKNREMSLKIWSGQSSGWGC